MADSPPLDTLLLFDCHWLSVAPVANECGAMNQQWRLVVCRVRYPIVLASASLSPATAVSIRYRVCQRVGQRLRHPLAKRHPLWHWYTHAKRHRLWHWHTHAAPARR